MRTFWNQQAAVFGEVDISQLGKIDRAASKVSGILRRSQGPVMLRRAAVNSSEPTSLACGLGSPLRRFPDDPVDQRFAAVAEQIADRLDDDAARCRHSVQNVAGSPPNSRVSTSAPGGTGWCPGAKKPATLRRKVSSVPIPRKIGWSATSTTR